MDNQEILPATHELPVPTGNVMTGPDKSAEVGAHKELPLQGGGQQPVTVAGATNAVVAAHPATADPTASTGTLSAATAHLSAADVDLIEKEWVQKAKAIVAATNGDPYSQNKEINKMKADYIKKRYNKDIKVASE